MIRAETIRLFDLTGRIALVTGGNSGIGETMARALAGAGAGVVLVARREQALAAAIDRLRSEGLSARSVSCDLADPVAITRMCAAAGAVDILVNAAGMNLRQPFMDVTAETFDRHLALHLRAPFLLAQRLDSVLAIQPSLHPCRLMSIIFGGYPNNN